MTGSDEQGATGAPQWPAPGQASAPPAWTAPAGAPPSQPSAVPPAPVAPPSPAAPGQPSGPAYGGAYGSAYGSAAAPTYRSWQPGILPLKPMGFGDFLAVPFKALRFNRAVMLGAPLLFTLVSTILTLTTLWIVFNDPQLGLMSAAPTLSGISGETVALIVIAIAAALLADVFSSSIIAPGVARAVLGERITIATAWKQVQHRLGSLLLLYLVSFVAMIAVIAIACAPLLLAAFGDGAAIAGGIVLTALLFLSAIPVFLAITVVQGVTRALIVLEDVSMAAGVRRALGLIKGRFWWSLLIVFVAMVLINIAASVFQYVGQFGGLAVSFVAPESVVALAVAFFVVYGIAYVVSMVLVYAYIGAIFALLYVDLRMRHEGFDIDLARAAEARAAAAAGRA
ncbi:hypothetical protein [Demequina sp. NBRC 110051]|uniref:hypothetical protein n=1 Tax=Demequina sp. NBRC 110051 TaxID=1570340 RepID=UPI000A02C235|nr:hypothetical protein [Demequina sp. NBRC 110051]